MKRLTPIVRILMGLGFVTFGLNYFLQFLPAPTNIPPAAGQFVGALVASGYVMTIVKVVEIGAGLLLLGNRFVPLALVLLAPVIVGFMGFHLALAPAGLPVPLVFLAFELFLAWQYRGTYALLFDARRQPA